MITTYKAKTYDAGQDLNGLKDQLGSVLKEIAAFGGRLEESRALQLHADDYGFAKSFSYEERLRDLKTKLQPGREPAKPVIFLTRMVVESLSRGPMSEKDIKTIVLERCKEVGIKSSNRGLIAGTGMDVATVCSVLAALGAIEAAAPPDSKAEPDLSLLASTAHPSLNTTISTVNTSPELITGPGSTLYSVLSDRWQSRLHEYIDDALKSKAAALLNDNLTGTSGEASGVANSVVKTEGSTSLNVPVGTNATLHPHRAAASNSMNNISNTSVKNGNTNPNLGVYTGKSTAPAMSMYNNPLGSGHTSAATSAGVTPSTSSNNIAGIYQATSGLTSPIGSTTQTSSVVASPAPTATAMSNTARLIAEYNSRNGIDTSPSTTVAYSTSNSAALPPASTGVASYNTSGTSLNSTVSGAPGNSLKPLPTYTMPLTSSGGSLPVTSNTTSSIPNMGTASTISTSTIPAASNVSAGSYANTLPMNQGNTIGYRASLGPDNSTINTTYNTLPNSTYPVLSSTSMPLPYTSTSYTNANSSLPNTTMTSINNTINTNLAKPYTVPHSDPATTPATVGFLSVTNPTNKLVLPYMNADGTLSKSASLSNMNSTTSNGMSSVQNGMLNTSAASNVNHSLNTNVSNSLTMNTLGNISTYNTHMGHVPTNSISSVGNNSTLAIPYQPTTQQLTTTTPMMGYSNNTMPLNSTYTNNTLSYPIGSTHYGASFVTNTTNTQYQPSTINPNTNYIGHNNSTINTATANANSKAKAKTPKPPAEKKLSKKAAAAASKLVDNNTTSRVNNSTVLGNYTGGSASSSLNGTVTSGSGVNSNKARRGPSALRVWKLREEYVNFDITNSGSTDAKSGTSASSSGKTTNAALALLLDPTLLGTAASIHYNMHAALETEERLLRRIAGLCNFNLKPNRYRLGTAMLSSDPDIMSRTSATSSRLYGTTPSTYTTISTNTNAATSTTKTSAKYSDASSNDDYNTEPTYSVYDETTPITATYLLDKIRRSKRQRGEVLYGNISLPYAATTASVSAARNAAAASVGVYSAPHVHALAAVVSKTADYFWSNSSNGKNNKSKKTLSAATSVNANKAEPITMAQYARNVHTGVGGNNIVLSSCSNGASITNHTLRRYAQPIELYNAHLPCDVSKINAFAAATGGHHNTSANASSNNGTTVLSIPDLTLNTREIAWTSIAAEFAVLPAPTEEGSIGFGYSASTAAIDTVSGFVDTTTSSVGNSSLKKRKYLNNDTAKASKSSSSLVHTNTSTGSGSNASSSSNAASTLAMEVLAPQFTEIEPITTLVEKMKAQQQGSAGRSVDSNDSGSNSDGEDTSDEACLARHEAVLQGMRDKWTRLQQLKNDALYGPGGAPPDTKTYRGGGGYGGYFNRAATAPAGANAASIGTSGNSLELSPLGSPVGFDVHSKFQNLSPRKRGLASAHAKRRGRPPKNVKHSHHSHSVIASVVSHSGGKEIVPSGDVSVSDETMEVDELVE